MKDWTNYKAALEEKGFTTLEAIYTPEEVAAIIDVINQADHSKETFRKSADLFAIRQFLKEIPEVCHLIFNHKLQQLIREVFGQDYFVVKSIYFDKPEKSNWYVAYHQDLTISVDKKIVLESFGPWTIKQGQSAVQPPIDILENIFTLRIHLDDTDADNGALRVIEQSHRKKIYRPEMLDRTLEQETICPVKKGGIMIMKPLLLHSSARSTNHKKRRVIHIECSNVTLPGSLNWAEKLEFPKLASAGSII
ncbi:MAG: phytanoyl-CoA dioxygenase [Bacteroidetes bacterium 43-16]|nr:MAG: phytanoyl-CoA dioxygenase [Bacteroidetes bacterium 43-16]